jgi:uncharacterized membrane protein YphA (DoxX/SURF4 family)
VRPHVPSAPTVSLVARVLLAGVFVVAGGLKLADPQVAVQAVRAYRLLPSALEAPVGWGLPAFEIALGLLLAVGLFTRVSAVAAAVLLTVFIAGVASAAARGLSIDCGCFGGGGTVAPGETKYASELLRDVGLLVLAGWLVGKPESRFSLD